MRGQGSRLTQPDLPADDATRNEFYARGVVSYELDLWGRYAHASDAARNRLLATEFDRDAFRLSLSGRDGAGLFRAGGGDRPVRTGARDARQPRGFAAHRATAVRRRRERRDHVPPRRGRGRDGPCRDASCSSSRSNGARTCSACCSGAHPRDLVEQKLLPQALGSSTAVALLPEGMPADVLTRRPDIRAAEAQLAARGG